MSGKMRFTTTPAVPPTKIIGKTFPPHEADGEAQRHRDHLGPDDSHQQPDPERGGVVDHRSELGLAGAEGQRKRDGDQPDAGASDDAEGVTVGHQARSPVDHAHHHDEDHHHDGGENAEPHRRHHVTHREFVRRKLVAVEEGAADDREEDHEADARCDCLGNDRGDIPRSRSRAELGHKECLEDWGGECRAKGSGDSDQRVVLISPAFSPSSLGDPRSQSTPEDDEGGGGAKTGSGNGGDGRNDHPFEHGSVVDLSRLDDLDPTGNPCGNPPWVPECDDQ